MKIDLLDITFLMLVRLDSIHRLENILVITETLQKYFDTNIIVLEVDGHNNNILKRLLNRKIRYQFIEDKDPILYKTKYINIMALNVKTPFIAIWDIDIIVDKGAIMDSVSQLRNNHADVAYPYNGKCYDVPKILRNIYREKRDIRLLYRHLDKMHLLYNRELVGGAVFVSTQKYYDVGMENESHYGWGNDDFDRFYRFMSYKNRIYRSNTCLFHLSHIRGHNSKYHSDMSKELSISKCINSMNSSYSDLQDSSKSELAPKSWTD